MKLVYFAPVPFSSFWQRPHYMVDYLLASGIVTNVLWVNPYPVRLPRFSDLNMKFHSEEHVGQKRAGVDVLNVKALPVEPLPFFNLVNEIFFKEVQQVISNYSKSDNCIIGVGRPSRLAAKCVLSNHACRSFMDVMDDFSAFYGGLSATSMRKREKELALLVDIIICSASGLTNKFEELKRPVALIRNAYPMARLEAAHQVYRNLDLIGFVGTVADWFDWDLVIELATALPNKLVRIIGPIRCVIPQNLPQNIELLPECSVDQAIEFTAGFGVGIIPFKINQLTSSVDPIKFYEMRALGIPIWSTDFGTMSDRIIEGQAHLLKKGLDWSLQYEKVISDQLSESDVINFRNDNDWSGRFARLPEVFGI